MFGATLLLKYISYGVAVCTVLNALLDRTLELKGFQFRKPVHSAAES